MTSPIRNLLLCVAAAVAIIVSGCNGEETQTNSGSNDVTSSGSDPEVAQTAKIVSNGCWVTQQAGSAKIDCSDSSTATVNDGTNGTNGTNGAAGASGATGATGAQGAAGLDITVVDRLGVTIGRVVSYDIQDRVTVYKSSENRVAMYNMQDGKITKSMLYFPTTDCSLQGWFHGKYPVGVVLNNDGTLYETENVISLGITILSKKDPTTGSCNADNIPNFYGARAKAYTGVLGASYNVPFKFQ